MPNAEPVYFAVVKEHGQLSPRRFFGQVPSCYLLKERRHEMVFCLRIDTLKNADQLITAPLDKMLTRYQTLVRLGKKVLEL